jgi:predicted acetyltransferase
MTGIAVVGVGPEHRGRGAAVGLMKQMLQELHESEVPLSGLYPATQSLYRLAGYECSGGRFQVEMAPRDIRVKDRGLALRPAVPDDRQAIQDVYRVHAMGFDGHLDRGSYVWDRVYEFRKQPATGYVVEEEGRITGYVFVLQQGREPYGYNLQLTDLTALTPGAGRRILSFLADYRSMVEKITWFGGPNHPILMLLPEQYFSLSLQMYWMIRIVRVAAALEGRGYDPRFRGALHLEVEDDVIPDNAGRYILEVEDGSARVRQGGNGNLRLHIRALAPLYSGFLSPASLRTAGFLEGDDESVRTASGFFAGSTPWMPDMF